MSTTSSVDCDRFEMTRHEYEEKLSSEFQTRQTFLVVIETLICLVITGVSILGNGLVFVAVYRNPRLRKPSNLYIISLAVSDLILSAVAMPFTCVSAKVGNWMFGAGDTVLVPSVFGYHARNNISDEHGSYCSQQVFKSCLSKHASQAGVG